VDDTSDRTLRKLLRRPSAILPLVLSGAAIALVVAYVASHEVVRSEDEGAPARLFQLLLAAQLPLIAWFAATALPRAWRPALIVLGLQVLGGATAIALVVLLER
jgi:hypothetical protein